MLEKEFVPYTESLELKQLDFDEPCFAYYDEEAGETEPYEYANCNHNVTGNKACYNDDFLSVTNSQLDENGAFCEKDEEGTESFSRWTAPTYSQAFRWFRGKYGLHYYITTHDETDYEWYVYDKDQNDWEDDTTQATYEDAELACLRKLIEIVKNK
jgi:hypothetical protein